MRIRIGTIVILLSCLGTSLASSGQGDDASDDVVGAVEKADRHSAPASNEAASDEMHFDLATIKRHVPKSVPNSELFNSKSWYVPSSLPAQQIVNLPPPPPSAPPMPFTYTGRMIDGNDVVLFLSRSGHHYTVKKGDTVDDTYRVDEIKTSEATITHIPTNTQQTLAFSSTAVGSSSLASAAANTAPAIDVLHKPLALAPQED